MNAKHTPGPWITHPFQLGEIGRWRVIQLGQAGGSPGLCVVHPRPDAKVAAANARLIAAAPELLTALRDCALVMQNDLKGLPVIQPELRAALAAIHKATGEAI